MEIAYHLLEATYVHLYFIKGPLDQVKAEGGGANSDAGRVGYGSKGDTGTNRGQIPIISVAAKRVY